MVFTRMAAWLLTASVAYCTPLFVDCSRDELIQAVPELGSLEFDSSQNALDPLLHETQLQLAIMFAGMVDFSMAEDAHQMRFESVHLRWSEQRDPFQYTVQIQPLRESRPGQYLGMLNDFRPENSSRFRYLGRMRDGSLVLAFLTRNGARQGLAWVDASNKRIVRLRTDILKGPEGETFESL
ncbi:MAG TPA: hypothetical protein VKT81_11120, partial [Bryobacteraceae bacterium]|nr:hypothetical protein [Bryobacteraceae bacterium]